MTRSLAPRSFVIVILFLFCLIPSLHVVAQPPYAGTKREFRGVWIASVLNYDWPLNPHLAPQLQRDSLVALLDLFAAARFNAVIFQIRPECDALYDSPFEPWSYWLTGQQGTGPSPSYDPLQFAAAEAHRRGMELHAWVNPYRAYRQDNSYPTHPTHVTQAHPTWVITCPDGYKFLDPGLPQVRDHVAKVVADVTRRYDVDGIHFDDYFYPYPEHSFTRQDSSTWAAYPRGFSWDSLAYWRRDNVNLLIRQVFDSVQAIKPWVKFGVSPFGIWKNNVPPGVTGLSSYDVIYCDAPAWLQGQYIDYVVPQLYWKFGGGQDYAKLQPWWASQRNGRHFYTGNADYRIEQDGWPATEITAQIRFNQTTANAQGSVQFRAYNIRANDGGIADALRGDVFRYPSLAPVMPWKETLAPNAPVGLQMTYNSGLGAYELSWQPPAPAADGDTAARYAVYRFFSPPEPASYDLPQNLLTLTGTPTIVPPARVDSMDVRYYYAVTALDRNNNESGPSGAVSILSPVPAPVLLSPVDGEQFYARGAMLTWRKVEGAIVYRLQLDSSGAFLPGTMLLNVLTPDTSDVPLDLKAGKTYTWRVIAGSQTGESVPSPAWTFRTGWPLPPVPVYPVTVANVPRLPTFVWRSSGGDTYRVRVVDNSSKVTVVDTTVSDTTFTCTTLLAASRLHVWNVSAKNAYGESEWSAEARFQTGTVISGVGEDQEVPSSYVLSQNYPNPFNGETRIQYQVSSAARVRLAVYDLLGREVALLVNELKLPGRYSVSFDASRSGPGGTGLASGVYIYRLTADGPAAGSGRAFVQSRAMVLLQ